jgi:steroid delta-isomerase-like uncharacterized protein
MSHAEARALVTPFYEALQASNTARARALVESVASPEWRSYAGETQSKGREEFIQQVLGFGQALPDLTWNIREVYVDGDTVIVRSEARGTPAGPFMGVPHGGKSFAIMTLDVHTTQQGKLVRAHHVEDWAGALRQLRG